MSTADKTLANDIVLALAMHIDPLSPAKIAKAVGVPQIKVRSALRALERQGRVASTLTGSPPAAVYTTPKGSR